MLKSLHKNDTQITPFVATKDWELTNVKNEDLVLMEHSGSDGDPVALEYIEYGSESIDLNYGCSVAKENQLKDRARFRLGLNLSGIFYPETDPQNIDGTYQRMVYSQIKGVFYNNYRDPTKIWGMEQIDFDKSQTYKFLSDQFQLYDIPTNIFGEKMLENSVVLYNTNLDNDYTITDDGHNNLYAGPYLFSRQQELGQYRNEFLSGSDSYCGAYFSLEPSGNIVLVVSSGSALLDWTAPFHNEDGWYIERYDNDVPPFVLIDTKLTRSLRHYVDNTVSEGNKYCYRVWAFNGFGTSSYSNTACIYFLGPVGDSSSYAVSLESGSVEEFITVEESSYDIGLISGSMVDIIVPITASETASVMDVSLLYGSINTSPPYAEYFGTMSAALISGSLLTIVMTASVPGDTASFEVAFYSGSAINVIISASMPPETESIAWGFVEGEVFNVLVTGSMPSHSFNIEGGFYSGSLTNWISNTTVTELGTYDVGLISGSMETLCSSFSAITPRTGPAPLSVTFSNDSSPGRFNSFVWIWGDGTANATTPVYNNMSHSYSNVGTYDVSLRAISASYSNSFTASGYVVVS